MFSDFRYPLILFLSSFILMPAGIILNVLHWPGARLLLGSMLMVQAFSIIWLIIIIIKTPKP